MLTHRNAEPVTPARVVVLGSRGFLGQEFMAHLESAGIPALGISSADIDLTVSSAPQDFAAKLQADDALVIFSALTPDKGRDVATFMKNLRMIETVLAALEESPVAHVTYISSDAVYPMHEGQVTEQSCAEPEDLYGTMHKAREVMLENSPISGRLAILRLTLVYGHHDSHNSYGPNRLRRAAAESAEIKLFGAGEETRDHLFVDDAVKLIAATVEHASTGMLNLCTGQSVSYDTLAHMVADCFPNEVAVIHQERDNPITHRHFDITALRKAFPSFVLTPLEEGLKTVHRQMIDDA